MTSTAPLPVSADPAVPPVPSLSLVPAPRLAVEPAGSPAVPAPLFAASRSGRPVAPRPVSPAPDPSDPSAPAANRPRFRRLVVFTGQLS